uniref:Uncharacterized protein n=1 Tax=Panagrolaimus davidi TaxID=227884 RepID=A0A914P6R9_9BILA
MSAGFSSAAAQNRPDSSLSYMSNEDQELIRYQRAGVQQLKNAYLEQIRRDELRHARHRTTPVIGIATRSFAGTPSLPDIAEAPHEGSSASSVTTEYAANQPTTLVRYKFPLPLDHIERRRSSFISETQQHHQQSLSSSHQEYESSRYHSDTPLSRQKRSNSQLLYPPGSTDQIASEHTPAQRAPEKVVYENKPFPPAVVSLNITPSSSQQQSRLQGRFERPNQPPSRHPEDDYSERLMSPPPGRQTPKSILKQSYSQQQHYSDQEQSWEQSSHITRQQQNMSEPPSTFPNLPSNEPSNRNINRTPAHYGSNYELDEAENIRIMQENLRKHREQRNYTPQNVPRYPTTSFNGPFFKLEEVTAPHSNGSERPRNAFSRAV